MGRLSAHLALYERYLVGERLGYGSSCGCCPITASAQSVLARSSFLWLRSMTSWSTCYLSATLRPPEARNRKTLSWRKPCGFLKNTGAADNVTSGAQSVSNSVPRARGRSSGSRGRSPPGADIFAAGVAGIWLLISLRLPHRGVHWKALVPGALAFGLGLGLI